MLHTLVTGATGYVGGLLVPELLDAGHRVRALARNPATADVDGRAELVRGDLAKDEGLDDALAGIDVAYYLVHSMGRGNPADFAEQDRVAARSFGRAAARAGVARVIYLGGLEDGVDSAHLKSRHEVAQILREHLDEVVYVRAAMVIGAGSASFVMMSKLVERLPVMVCPRWIDTRTQPIAVRDVTAALVALATREEAPEEVQLGGPEVLTYREMMRRTATLSGRRAPLMVKVPVLTPGLSSWWVVLVTPIDMGLVRPLVEGLSAEMVVTEAPPPGLNDHPQAFDAAVREALAA